MIRIIIGAAILGAPAGAYAQETTQPTAPASETAAPAPAIAAAPATSAVLRVGTEVALKMAEQLTTKNKAVRVGQRFRLEVADDVKVNDKVVIPAGSPAMGEITDVRNKGMWGKSGHIGAQLLYVQVNGRQVRLSGTFDDKGVTGTAGVVAAIALVPIAGFFTTGTSADIPVGAGVKGFINEDVPLTFAATEPQPLPVATPAAALPVQTAAAPAAPAEAVTH